jgi:hypothetical protein
MQCISAAIETSDLDLPAFEFSLANTTNPLIVERIPSPESISRTQDRQSILEFDVSNHNAKNSAHCFETNNREAG